METEGRTWEVSYLRCYFPFGPAGKKAYSPSSTVQRHGWQIALRSLYRQYISDLRGYPSSQASARRTNGKEGIAMPRKLFFAFVIALILTLLLASEAR